MEDDFLISIGSLLGAEVVVTGSISGQGVLRRFRLKALDVKTGIILGMSTSRI
jgi:hypothetical protein